MNAQHEVVAAPVSTTTPAVATSATFGVLGGHGWRLAWLVPLAASVLALAGVSAVTAATGTTQTEVRTR